MWHESYPLNLNDLNFITLLYRREKSLSELTKNFMRIHGRDSDSVIALDKWTSQLNTEKRRVYDIMNIFEGFGAVSRKAKNLYSWKGLQQIGVALDTIKERWNIIHSQTTQNNIEYTLRQYNFERVKSLGFLCESFICLFLLWKPVISLEEAASKISKILLNDSQLKTKVRRLYDIANVLCVLKIIRKTLMHTGKPGFQWVGRAGIEEFAMDIEYDGSPAGNNTWSKVSVNSNKIDACSQPSDTQASFKENEKIYAQSWALKLENQWINWN